MNAKNIAAKVLTYLVLCLGAVIMLLPFIWMISSSLMTFQQTLVRPPVWLPTPPQWGNFARITDYAPHFPRYFLNNIIVAGVGTTLEVITACLAAYAFARMRFWGRDVLFIAFLATMMVPPEVLLIPNFITIVNLGWIDTYQALILPWAARAISIFLLRQFFMTVPVQLSYAAKVDGCRSFRFLLTVMVPLAKPAIVTISLLSVIGAWNAFTWPLLVTNDHAMRTLPLGLALFRGEAGTFFHLLMAASVAVVLPMVILFILLQKHIVAGVARSGLKG